ncbi:alpha/beta-hydrolase [Stereum hirsutum FP-91666 SS1]|uniref:Alpha/beta-hydrolase n=1 Tax=Stereum hirsutum (strain FP-91666) TaxID=721885 RepID=R7RWC0_STEHR|nr:alpha/beta-hydrolase [Stereum hirsutum FP-91666 SS1]EIM79594.1 alpha/beta-hydrolase [Stereum hirsutum FP-91666 SS1]
MNPDLSYSLVNVPSRTPGTYLDVACWKPNIPGPFPVIIAGHGMTLTKDAGLKAFAQRWATNAGFASLLMDYRGFGSSGGEPRNLVSLKNQTEDFLSVVEWVKANSDQFRVDKIVVMGSAMSGLNVAELVVRCKDLAGGMAHCPLLDGYATLMSLDPNPRLLFWAAVDCAKSWLGLAPLYVPAVGKPGEFAFINSPTSYTGFTKMYEKGDRPFSEMPNVLAARLAFEVFSARPGLMLKNAKSPMLIVMAEEDDMIPVAITRDVVAKSCGKVEFVAAPGGHYDVMEGGKGFETNISAQVDFLRRLL